MDRSPPPKGGDTRLVHRFALWPTRLSDRTTMVWLGWYAVDQVYYARRGWDTMYTRLPADPRTLSRLRQ